MTEHIKKIFCGEYDFHITINKPVVIDIGANVGAFTRWSYARWSSIKTFCFEPIKDNFETLKKNTSDLDNVEIYNCAIGSSDRKQKMFYGRNNEGEASLFLGKEQIEAGEEVDVICAGKLPKCDVMKIDAEGSEIEILEHYKQDPLIYIIEYHSEKNRLKIDKILNKKYILHASNSEYVDYGILKYVSKTLITSN
jgi:FkbM family methyltransferase